MFRNTESINIKVQHKHKQALKALARLEDEPMSVILRRLIRKTAIERGIWPGTKHSGLQQSDEKGKNNAIRNPQNI